MNQEEQDWLEDIQRGTPELDEDEANIDPQEGPHPLYCICLDCATV